MGSTPEWLGLPVGAGIRGLASELPDDSPGMRCSTAQGTSGRPSRAGKGGGIGCGGALCAPTALSRSVCVPASRTGRCSILTQACLSARAARCRAKGWRRSSGIGRARLPSITSMVEKRSTRPRRTACL
eukprot:2425645-Alexandrium_andersonii.AAC.1